MDVLQSRMEDLAATALRRGCAVSRFLTPAEQVSTAAHFARQRDITLCFDGGYEGAERARAVFLQADWGTYERSECICALQIATSSKESLGHRDILGALMALGIERDTVGDILLSPPTLLCLPELRLYITENLCRAGHAKLTLTELSTEALSADTENLSIRQDTVASLRLDAVLATAFGLSRTKAAELIEAARVRLNHSLCLQPSRDMEEGDIFSIRGLGRAKLLEVGGLSKKGRIFIKTGLYGL